MAAATAGCGWGIETCAPTVLEARPATGPRLVATLRTGDQALRGRPVVFSLRSGEAVLERAEATVGRDGEAVVELAGVPAGADRFTAHFAGDRAFCEARDTAPLGR